MMLDWKLIATDLYRALNLLQSCHCEYERNAAGVPVWSGIPLERKLLKRCSSCLAKQAYGDALK